MYHAVPPPQKTANSEGEPVKTDEHVGSPCPSGVSENMWKKFRELKERRVRCCKSSVESRKKALRKEATEPVFKQLQSPEELSILREYGVVSPRSSRKNHVNTPSLENSSTSHGQNEKKWKELKHHFNTDLQCEGEVRVSATAKEKIKEEINNSIKDGNFDKAEKLSQELGNQDFMDKVTTVVGQRDYSKRKVEEQERTKRNKKPKLHWGFEQKQRWESKGNM